MLQSAQIFMQALEKEDLKYKDARDLKDGSSLVVCGFNGKNTRYDIAFIFDSDDRSVSVRVFRLVSGCPEDSTLRMLDAINEINAKYRWVKFYLDKDQDINVQLDAYVNHSVDDNICLFLLMRTVKIIDECYPTLMRALWAN